MAAAVVRFRIDFAEHTGVGPGKIGLLEASRDFGSLAQGARNIGMSYRHAWLLVERLKRSFREPVTEIYAAGKGGYRHQESLSRNFNFWPNVQSAQLRVSSRSRSETSAVRSIPGKSVHHQLCTEHVSNPCPKASLVSN